MNKEKIVNYDQVIKRLTSLNMNNSQPGQPLQIFGNLSAIAVVIGIVIGIGIFRLPTMVAQNSSTELHYISFWVAGGLISILGALCYAELASSRPDAGGEYHFLTEAYGSTVGFLFSWGRMTVIQTGSIALAAFILGDYATAIYNLGAYSSSVYAGITIALLTGLNILGTRSSRNVQSLMTAAIVGILLLTGFAGLFYGAELSASSVETPSETINSSAGAAMIFVLLTYGGWNEGVYLSAEIKNVRQNISKVLLFGLAGITLIYVLVNTAYLQVLGLDGLRNSDTIGIALSNQIMGSKGSFIIAVIVVISAFSTANATIITGARTNYALGRDFPMFKFIGRWNTSCNAPVNALLVQGGIALGLVILGSITKEAVTTMVDYTAPVFWFFILLTTVSLFIFRGTTPKKVGTFKVPFYPLIPILFIIVCLYLLYSSIIFTGMGAFVGIAILLIGLPLYFAGGWQKD